MILKKHQFKDVNDWYKLLKGLGYPWCSQTKWMTEVSVIEEYREAEFDDDLYNRRMME